MWRPRARLAGGLQLDRYFLGQIAFADEQFDAGVRARDELVFGQKCRVDNFAAELFQLAQVDIFHLGVQAVEARQLG